MLKGFLIGLAIFLAIDFIWLGLIAKNFYNKELASFNRTFNLVSAFLSYLLIVLGIILFVLPKAGASASQAFFWGGLFGRATYPGGDSAGCTRTDYHQRGEQ